MFFSNNSTFFCEKTFECKVFINDLDHHKSHAILAFEKSKFNESLVFVIDRNGIQNGKIFEVESIFHVDKEYKTWDIYKNFGIETFWKIF